MKGRRYGRRKWNCTRRIRGKEEFVARGILSIVVVRKTASCIVDTLTIM